MGITVIVLGLAAQLWIALAALVLGGAVNLVLSTFRNALSQALTDDAMRGRIQGTLTVVLIGGPNCGTTPLSPPAYSRRLTQAEERRRH
ncbi:MAG: hypothetical protein JWM19_7241 [Actinomycetia bacterium]|nr:hypothetical protein [Actinomycetes bacterium]